jgi:hypothetical protein
MSEASTNRKRKALSTPSFKVIIKIKGATDQSIYGDNLRRLELRAIRLLTAWKPGMGSLYPDRLTIYERSGRLDTWVPAGFTLYTEIPEDQLEWRKREALRR